MKINPIMEYSSKKPKTILHYRVFLEVITCLIYGSLINETFYKIMIDFNKTTILI